jgi:hypothetical protein
MRDTKFCWGGRNLTAFECTQRGPLTVLVKLIWRRLKALGNGLLHEQKEEVEGGGVLLRSIEILILTLGGYCIGVKF